MQTCDGRELTDAERDIITTVSIITDISESCVLGAIECVIAGLQNMEDEHDKLKELAESLNSGCEIKGETRDFKGSRQFIRVTRMKSRENEEKLPKKLRNGWKQP